MQKLGSLQLIGRFESLDSAERQNQNRIVTCSTCEEKKMFDCKLLETPEDDPFYNIRTLVWRKLKRVKMVHQYYCIYNKIDNTIKSGKAFYIFQFHFVI